MKNIFQQSAKKPKTECKVCLDYGQVVDTDPNTGRKIFLPCPKCSISKEEIQECVKEVRETFIGTPVEVTTGDFNETSPKDEDGKIKMELLMDMPEQLEEMGDILTRGIKKYPLRKGWATRSVDQYKGALQRHFLEFCKGYTLDKETGCSHMLHVAINAMFIDFLTKRDC